MAPLADSFPSLVYARDTQNSNTDQVPITGIIIGSIVGIVLVTCLLICLFRSKGFLRRRGWVKLKKDSQHLSPPENEMSLAKHTSIASERESIMFSRSRASSLQFAVVEDIDAQRRMSSQVYVLRGDQYVPVQQQQADTERNSLLSHDVNQMSEVDISSVDNDQFSIPVVVSPPPESIQQPGYNSRAGSINQSDDAVLEAVSSISDITNEP